MVNSVVVACLAYVNRCLWLRLQSSNSTLAASLSSSSSGFSCQNDVCVWGGGGHSSARLDSRLTCRANKFFAIALHCLLEAPPPQRLPLPHFTNGCQTHLPGNPGNSTCSVSNVASNCNGCCCCHSCCSYRFAVFSSSFSHSPLYLPALTLCYGHLLQRSYPHGSCQSQLLLLLLL